MGTPRTLFVGDVHGCARELEDLLSKADPTRVLLVGDLFTKGPDTIGVWNLIRAFDAEAVLGNHDQRVLDKWRRWRDLPRPAFRVAPPPPLDGHGSILARRSRRGPAVAMAEDTPTPPDRDR